MTVAAEAVTAGRPAPVLPPAGAPGPVEVPRLAGGVELLGEYKDSGYSQPPSLVRRPDGQVIQMSALLYQVVCQIDIWIDRKSTRLNSSHCHISYAVFCLDRKSVV